MTYDVIIATYNGSDYISQQIDSILSQTVKPNQILIRDDGSTDNTMEIILEYQRQHDCVKVIDGCSNLGYIKNFNELTKYTKSDVVFFCDQDDVWKENKAECLISEFILGEASAIFTNATITDGSLKKIGYLFDVNGFYNNQMTLNQLLRRNFVTGATLAVKRCYLNTITPFPDMIPHDFYIAIHSILDGKLFFIDKCLIKYRQHENNVVGLVKRKTIFSKISDFNQLRLQWIKSVNLLSFVSDIFKNKLDSSVCVFLKERNVVLRESRFQKMVWCFKNKNIYIKIFGMKQFLRDLVFYSV